MGNFTGVIINKANGGLVRDTDTSDRVILLVVGGSEIGKLEYYKPEALNDITDLEALGWDDTIDLENKELVHYHTSEVFRLSPERSLYLMLVPKSEKVSSLLTKENFVNAVRTINGVNTIGICSLTADETITVAVQEAQKMVNKFREDHLYIDAVILEGVGKYINAVADAVDLRTLDAENVSVVIAQDPAWAAKDEAYRTHAAVGSALGMLSVRYVHENMGSVDIERLVTDSHLFWIDVNVEVRDILRIDHAFQRGFDKRVPTADSGVADISGGRISFYLTSHTR